MKKPTIKRTALALLALYAFLFIARAVYDLAYFEDSDTNYNIYYDSISYVEKPSTLNIATFRQEYLTPGTDAIEQKYEKVASLVSKTIQYTDDEKKLKTAIEECLAVIQMENTSGLPGSRRLHMILGVKPDYFDSAVEMIGAIGRITSFTTTKTDKTYEYRQMLAEKDKLARQIESFESLKGRGGSITELLLVEDRIIEVESLLQTQSVMLGDYSDENALCTINFTMHEGNETTIWRKLWNALRWSTTAYLALIGICILTCAASAIVIAVWKYAESFHTELAQKAASAESKVGSRQTDTNSKPDANDNGAEGN